MLAHDVGDGVLGVLDGAEVAGAESLRDEERGPARSILPVPDLDVSSLGVEEVDEVSRDEHERPVVQDLEISPPRTIEAEGMTEKDRVVFISIVQYIWHLVSLL